MDVVRQGKRRASSPWRMWTDGVTMIELIVVLAVLALMAAVAIPTFARFGMFSRNELSRSARELYAMLRATKIYAATYRVDTALAYGLTLRLDSVTGQTIEAIDSVSMVYRMPDLIRKRCYFFRDVDGTVRDPAVQIPQESDVEVYIPVLGELEGGVFRTMVANTVVLAQGLLPDGSGNQTLADTLKPIRVYNVRFHHFDFPTGDMVYEAQVVAPMRVDESPTGALATLAPSLSYLSGLPTGEKYLEYCPNTGDPPREDTKQDFRFPAHVFAPSGRIDNQAAERFRIYVGYAPDADVRERFVDPVHPVWDAENGMRSTSLEMQRATGRVVIAGQEI